MAAIDKNHASTTVHTVDSLSQIFGVTPQTVRLELANGGIPGAFKVGRRWYVSDENLRRFMNGCSR